MLCGTSSGCLLPAPLYVLGEGGVLAYEEDLLEGQVLGHREAGHDDLVQLVGRFDVEDADHPSLAGDLVERDDLTCLHRSEGGFCLLFSDLPELI